ncbi:MAG: DUF2125 domain-containing protein [Rhodobacteraceae bacterium]|nr:DUF2125 domain-containing protein [Paracoccaceae bacterium]
MRFLTGLVMTAALLWCGWWALGSFGMRQAITVWAEDRRSEGWQADIGALSTGGFPTLLQTTLHDMAFADPATGVAVTADPLIIEASALWPGDVVVRLPESPMGFSAPDGKLVLEMAQGLMALNLHPGTDLELEALSWTSQAWEILDPAEPLLKGDGLAATFTQQSDPTTYDLATTVQNLTPGTALRDQLSIPADWPVSFDALRVDATVTFDQQWSRRALEDRRPQPRKIDLRIAEASWGALRLAIAADLDIDAQGQPEGTLAFQARNWRSILDLAERSGRITPAMRSQAEWALSSLADLSGNPDTIDVKLTLSGGFVRLGLLPIAPAPVFRLR